MNIFVLDINTKKCAEYHNDKHVVKMILETFSKFRIFINKKIWKLVKFVMKNSKT
jgi:glucose-6-phosphate 1-dehydrogenase